VKSDKAGEVLQAWRSGRVALNELSNSLYPAGRDRFFQTILTNQSNQEFKDERFNHDRTQVVASKRFLVKSITNTHQFGRTQAKASCSG
jgi:hypothetical protein